MKGSFRLGPDGVYRCDPFQHFIWQEHGFGTRSGNPPVNITLRQVHSARVVVANGIRDREEEGDALVTDELRQAIGIRTADCVPILLLDIARRVIGAVHAGWRGTAAEIAKRTVERMSETFHSKPSDIYAAIGPCIRNCCYEVGPEVADKLSSTFPEWREEEAGRRKLDLTEANCRHLRAAGIPDEHIFDSGLCTTCQTADFYSYRREPQNPGRMVASISRLA
ncbi:MAG: peptidoglycan editing factor PgeF [Acidobacteriaceae bacterium]|nr:peptidoglycan editing factor PgeF [Acidobacteriaceae bacterium]